MHQSNHLPKTKDTVKSIIPKSSSNTLRGPSVLGDGVAYIPSASVTRASSITMLDDSEDTEGSDTTSVETNLAAVIQDLEVELKNLKKDNHDLRSAMKASTSANAADMQANQEEKTALVARMESAVWEMNRLADINAELTKGIDVRNRARAIVETSRNRLREQVKKLEDDKEEMVIAHQDLERRVQELQADKETLERKVRFTEELKAGMRKLHAGNLEAEATVASLIRKIAKLEREQVSLTAKLGALNQQNEELATENAELVDQHTTTQEELESLQEYTRDLESQHDLLADAIAAREADYQALQLKIGNEDDAHAEGVKVTETDDAVEDDEAIVAETIIVVPRPLDYSKLDQANVQLLERVALLQTERDAFALQIEESRIEHDAEVQRIDIMYNLAQDCVTRLTDVFVINDADKHSSTATIPAQVEPFAAQTNGYSKEEVERILGINAASACRVSVDQSATPAAVVATSTSGGLPLASGGDDATMILLGQLAQQAKLRLCANGPGHRNEPRSPFFLPVTPLAPSYQEYEDVEQLEDCPAGSEGSDILGTPSPRARQINLPCDDEVFCSQPTAAATIVDFSLTTAPPCHFDPYAWQWVHEDDPEPEDIEAEDAFTPSPTTYHVCDPNKQDLFAANREAAFASGEMF